jgi:hypothetical protein
MNNVWTDKCECGCDLTEDNLYRDWEIKGTSWHGYTAQECFMCKKKVRLTQGVHYDVWVRVNRNEPYE